jgi:AraC-like DNA-binding protein
MFSARSRSPLKIEFPPSGISVFESHHDRSFRMSPVRHEYFKLLFVLKGAGVCLQSTRRQQIKAGDVIMVPRETLHHFEDDAKRALSLIGLCIKRHVFNEHPELLSLSKIQIVHHAALTSEVPQILRRLLFEQSVPKPFCSTMTLGLTLQLLAMVRRVSLLGASQLQPLPSAGAPELRVQAYISALPHNFGVNEKIDNVAERLGVSRRYFTKIFRKLCGKSWLQYVRDLRLRHAQTLLRTSERSILLVAFECGFDDLSTFYRAFKTISTLTPHEYRQKKLRP